MFLKYVLHMLCALKHTETCMIQNYTDSSFMFFYTFDYVLIVRLKEKSLSPLMVNCFGSDLYIWQI